MERKIEKEVYRVISNTTNEPQRNHNNEYDFDSISSARYGNSYDLYKKKEEYRIAKYKVTYELIDDDCDPIIKEDLIEINKRKEQEEQWRRDEEKWAMKLYNKVHNELDSNEATRVWGEIIHEHFQEMFEKLAKSGL